MQHNSRILSVLAVLSLVLSLSGNISAQTNGVQNSTVHAQHDPPSMGRDLWFSLLTNYAGNTGDKYFALYITSPSATTAWVQLTDGAATPVAIKANQTTTFNMPLSWELQKSGQVERKAVHVWSKDADLCCYVMSHNDATSDGFYVYPAIGWGTQYVVAGYSALLAGRGGATDQPSEFAIISSTDNTQVSIIPSMDIRIEGAPGASCDVIFASRGILKSITLNRGESIQCKTTCTLQCPWDLTGTIVTASNPVGVICGSQCAFVPCDFGYCDHVCEMVPPTRTWATTYYTMPFIQPAGASIQHSASTFIVVGSKPNQNIYRMGADGTPILYCTLGSQFEAFERNDVKEASKWFSSDPFMLVQYINGGSYPDNINGSGDPAEVVISSVEQFFRTSVFLLPVFKGNTGAQFKNYVNVIATASDTNVFLDTINLSKTLTTSISRIALDGKYIGYRVANLPSGTGHIVRSDSGAGVYIYGYGQGESYAYSGAMGTATLNSLDSMPIEAAFSPKQTQETVTLRDTTAGGGVYYIRTDTLENVTFVPDSFFVEGHPVPSTYYNLAVIDPSKPATAVVSTFNIAGSRTTVTTTFAPFVGTLTIVPAVQNVTAYKDSLAYIYDTIVNATSFTIPLSGLSLQYGNHEFRIDSVVTSDLQPSDRRVIRIAYAPTNFAQSTDTLLFGSVKAALNGTMLIKPKDEVGTEKNAAAVSVRVEGRNLRTSLDEAASIDLLNTAGAVVLSGDIAPNGQLDVSSLAAGAYFYKLRSAHRTASGKITIQ
jgi:hypothetical protein